MRSIFTILLFIIGVNSIQAQDTKKFEFKGYIKDLQTLYIPSPDSIPWFSDNTIENRLQLKYYPTTWLTFDAQARSRFMYGDFVKNIPGYKDYISQNSRFFSMSTIWGSNKSFIAITEIDRLNAMMTFESWQITIGRQRVNWGINLIWNPNDIFNTYSYFNFEYEERSGTDAISVKYYTGTSSYGEVVYQGEDTYEKSSFAGLYRFNTHEYDIQVLAGKMKTDVTAGLGWTGRIGGAAFRGEANYFRPYSNFSDSKGVLISAISADYGFSNTLYIQGGFLFNSEGTTGKPGSINLFQQQDMSPKTLSRGKYNLFAQANGQLTPLIQPGLAMMFNPSDLSVFVSPSVTISIANNFDFSLVGLLFLGSQGTEYGSNGQMGYMKFKWSF
jgi:hypothetical protein